jgi:ligand-binding SRPBCC domain-containing protein
MRQRFVTTQWIPYPVDLVFAFFANPNNLPLLMPEGLKMRIDKVELVSPPTPQDQAIEAGQAARQEIAAGAGTQIEMSFQPVRYLPVRVRWVARISEFEWLSHFCDEQVRGPFEYFRHRHGIRSEVQHGQVGTELTDEVEFSLPLGTVGQFGNRVVLRQMKQMFTVRQERLPEILKVMARENC